MDRINDIKIRIEELKLQRKAMLCQLEKAKSEKMFIHELYEDLEKATKELIHLEKELYCLQQNSDDIIPN